MGCIYKITNITNGKIYIGQTRQRLQDRWADHKKNFTKLQDKMAIHYAMFKYGPDNFTLEEIEKCDNALLDEREIYWISFYHSYNNGYNNTIGGSDGIKIDYNKIFELWQDGNNLEDISKKMNIDRHAAAKALKSFDITELEIKTRALGRPVIQYTTKGEFVARYDSISEAGRIAGQTDNPSCIRSACVGTNVSAYGFLWKYADDPISIETLVHRFAKSGKGILKKVEQYDLDGNFIREYDSCREAARSINAPYHVGINACCLGRQKTAYGYKWKYKEI